MDNVLVKEIWINAPVEIIFKHFTDAELMQDWHGRKVQLNAVPGGIYQVFFENGDQIVGEFEEIVKNERLVYRAQYGEVQSTVEIEFLSEKDGTRVRLRQYFTRDQNTGSFAHGWDYFFGRLQAIWAPD